MLLAITRRRRLGLFPILAALFVLVVMLPPVLKARPAQAIDLCDFMPDPATRLVCQSTKNGIPTPGDVVGNAVKDATSGILTPLLNQFAQAEAESVGSLLNSEVNFINTNTTPAFSAAWFINQYAIIAGLAVLLGVGIALATVVRSVARSDIAGIGFAGISFGAFIPAVLLLPGAVAILVQVIDGSLTPALLHSSGVDITKLVTDATNNLTANVGVSNKILAPILIMIFGLLGGILTLVELLFREAMIYIMVFVEVVALAGAVGGRWTKEAPIRTSKILGSVILLKAIIALIYVTAINIGTFHTTGTDTNIQSLTGLVMLLLVPAISFTIYKLMSGHNLQVARGFVLASDVTKVVR